MGRAERAQARLVPLQVDAAHLIKRLGAQPALRQQCREGLLHRLLPNAPPAAHAQHRDARHEPQRARVGAVHRQFKIERAAVRRHARRGRARNGPWAAQHRHAARQYFCRHPFDARHIQHTAALPHGPLVHGERSVCVRGRGDDGQRAANSADAPGQTVRAAQVPAQQRHREAAAFVHRHHGRVRRLIPGIRRDGAHRDARRAHIDKRVRVGKGVGCPGVQRAAFAAARGLAG